MENFHKTVRIGQMPRYGDTGQRTSVFCWIELFNGNLTISGVVGPLASGNALGSCGQMQDSLKHIDRFAPGWNSKTVEKFYQAWEAWHLNDLHAECEHQVALGWRYNTHKGQSCPVCGYEIGTAWKRVEVPDDVIAFLKGLPDADKPCNWSNHWHDREATK